MLMTILFCLIILICGVVIGLSIALHIINKYAPDDIIIGDEMSKVDVDMLADNKLIGLAKDDVLKRLRDSNVLVRVMEEDGEALMGTMDFQPNRRNLTIEQGVVVKVERG